MFILLVRHAQPFWREEAKDPNNPELTELGIEQGKITGNYINLLKSMDITFDTIWHSELTRSRQTAELISKELDNNIIMSEHSWLNEVKLLDFKGMKEYAERSEKSDFNAVELDKWYEGFESMENFVDHANNLTPHFYQSLEDFGIKKSYQQTRNGDEKVWEITTDKNLLIVGHGGTNSVLLSELLSFDFKPWNVVRLGIDHASIAMLVGVSVGKEYIFRLQKLNDTHLLSPEKITR
tara:strand:- start:618 stop:1328 length:711 start_codon:yes stop_codon:yes gene_type:complete